MKKVICSKCRIEYSTRNNSHYCPPCHAEYVREWYLKNKDSVRNTQFKLKYGITLEEYEQLFLEQEGLCAICSKPQQGHFKYLSVDHNHEFNFIRGLLCTECNKGLGCFKDNIDLLRIAASYLEEYLP